MTNKEIFIETYNKNIHRPGAEKLLAWLEGTDFFTAPASTRFHAAYEGGLLDHSLNVYNVLISKHFNPETDDLESYTIVSLLHDLCKAGLRSRRPVSVWSRRKIRIPDRAVHAAAHGGGHRRALAHGRL